MQARGRMIPRLGLVLVSLCCRSCVTTSDAVCSPILLELFRYTSNVFPPEWFDQIGERHSFRRLQCCSPPDECLLNCRYLPAGHIMWLWLLAVCALATSAVAKIGAFLSLVTYAMCLCRTRRLRASQRQTRGSDEPARAPPSWPAWWDESGSDDTLALLTRPRHVSTLVSSTAPSC
jgi:hypothetical protein